MWAQLLAEIGKIIGGSITKANEYYTSRINTAGRNRATGALTRNLPVIIICVVALIVMLLSSKRDK